MRLLCKKLLGGGLILALLSTLLLQSYPGFSQERKVFRGTVTDLKNTPLEGVSIIVKGNTQGVSSGKDGTFTIETAEGSTLVFSSVGIQPKEIVARGSSLLQVQLVGTASTLNDVVVVGYGTQRRRDITGEIEVH